MTLIATVSKLFPTDNDVGIHLELTDDERPDLGEGAQVVISRVFTKNFVKGAGMTNQIRDDIGAEAQAAINAYKSTQSTYQAVAFDTAVTQIQNNLVI